MSDGLGVFLLAGEYDSKVVVRVGARRVETKCGFKLLDGAGEIAGLRERRSEIHARGYAVRLGSGRLTKLAGRFRIPSRLERDFAATEIHALTGCQILQ